MSCKKLKINLFGELYPTWLLCMITLRELGPFLVNTKKMSIPHVAAISAIALTTLAAGHFAYTNIKLYEKKIEIVHQQEQLQVDITRNNHNLEVEKYQYHNKLEFERGMLDIEKARYDAKLAFELEKATRDLP